MDFGRQPKPVKVTVSGEPQDVAYWRQYLAQRAAFKGDQVVHADDSFIVYPRAVND